MTLGVAARPALEDIEHKRTSVVTEPELVRGYAGATARPPATRDCVCGTGIRARSEANDDVAVAIRAHNRTDEHAAWRAREDIA